MKMQIIDACLKEEFEKKVNDFFASNEESGYVIIDRELQVIALNDEVLYTAFFVTQKLPTDILNTNSDGEQCQCQKISE